MKRLSWGTVLLLCVAPFMWAANAMVGRMMADSVPPMMLNFLRWLAALAILLPWGYKSLAWRMWRPHIWALLGLGLLGVASYNSLQYLALETSSPMNVTLMAASSPIWMLVVGRLFLGEPITARQMYGSILSLAGVLVVLSHGHASSLAHLRLVPGDLYMLIAAVAWAGYTWILARHKELIALEQDWAGFLVLQMVFGLALSTVPVGIERVLAYQSTIWSYQVVAAVIFIAVGPALIAYRAWGLGVKRVGPVVAAFFSNLTPLFAAVMSSALLHQGPKLHHVLAFLLIAGGIVLSG